MSAQPEDHQMEGVEQPTGVTEKGKGKGKADAMEDSAEDDSSDESGVEDNAAEEVVDEDDPEIDASNIIGKRTRGKVLDLEKAAEGLPEEDDDEDDEDYNDVDEDDEMKD